MRVRMRFPMIWLAFRRRFESKIDEKSTLNLEGLAKRKTLQNIGRGSKNQGSSFQKIMKNRLKTLQKATLKKSTQKFGEIRFSEPLGLVLGAEFVGFCVVFRSLFCDEMGLARKSAEVSGA